MQESGMTYAGAGVDEEALKRFKRKAQEQALATGGNLARSGMLMWEVPESRGESVHLIEFPDHFLAHLIEGLGTKSLVADAMYRLTGTSYYKNVAQDTFAAIINDLATSGASPINVMMYFGAGSAEVISDARSDDYLEGWKEQCKLAGCIWGGGETPMSGDLVMPNAAVLAGCAVGVIKPKGWRIKGNIEHGDKIILLGSSGIHANGLTLARKIAVTLPKGYLTKLPNGRTYGEALLDPTHVYASFVEDCLRHGVNIHYAANITGGGLRKLMRAKTDESFTYVIERLPRQPAIFDFLEAQGVDDREMYGTFNMGAGFALYVPEEATRLFGEAFGSRPRDFRAVFAGHVERSPETKVVIEPKHLEFPLSTLNIR